MKPIAPSWIIEDLGRLRRGRAERERAGAELPLPPPPSKDRREEQPVGGTVIVIEPWSPEPDGGEAIAVNQLKPVTARACPVDGSVEQQASTQSAPRRRRSNNLFSLEQQGGHHFSCVLGKAGASRFPLVRRDDAPRLRGRDAPRAAARGPGRQGAHLLDDERHGVAEEGEGCSLPAVCSISSCRGTESRSSSSWPKRSSRRPPVHGAASCVDRCSLARMLPRLRSYHALDSGQERVSAWASHGCILARSKCAAMSPWYARRCKSTLPRHRGPSCPKSEPPTYQRSSDIRSAINNGVSEVRHGN